MFRSLIFIKFFVLSFALVVIVFNLKAQSSCPLKRQGDADCAYDGSGKQNVALSDFEIWRKEYYTNCSAADQLACQTDEDGDGSAMDSNFNFVGSGNGNELANGVIDLIDFNIWRKGYFSSCQYPAQVLDLNNWYIGLPFGGPQNVYQPELANYRIDPWFTANSDCASVRFRAPVNGVTTSGSSFARSELRETVGSTHAAWNSESGTHTMEIEQAITHLPDLRKFIVAGQIHNTSEYFLYTRLEYPRLFISGNGIVGPTLDANYTLGKKFTIKYVVAGGNVNVYYNKGASPVFTYPKKSSTLYFKAGAYVQSNCSYESNCNENNYGEVEIYKLSVTHQ